MTAAWKTLIQNHRYSIQSSKVYKSAVRQRGKKYELQLEFEDSKQLKETNIKVTNIKPKFFRFFNLSCWVAVACSLNIQEASLCYNNISPALWSVFDFIGMATGLQRQKLWGNGLDRKEKRDMLGKTDGLTGC